MQVSGNNLACVVVKLPATLNLSRNLCVIEVRILV